MEYDFAIVYFGLTRSTKKVFKTHIQYIFNTIRYNRLTYKTFIHTWKTNDNKQKIWQKSIDQEIDYHEYKLLYPDFYKIDIQDDFIESINMNNYFYKEIWDKVGHQVNGEWLPELIQNHLCALESKKRGLEMVEEFVKEGNKFKYVMFLRPDVLITNVLPLKFIYFNKYDIYLPNKDHNEGYNDRFAVVTYDKAYIYGKRIDNLIEFRKNNGRIVSEKYVKFIIEKNHLKVAFIKFNFYIIRP
jgi:hypothetical protein